MDFRLTMEAQDATVFVSVSGELDVASAPRLDAAFRRLSEMEISRAVIDLRGLTLIDSSGLRAIIQGDDAFRARDATLSVIRGSRGVQRMVATARMADEIPFIEAP